MEIEITKPTPEAAELQALFNQTDKEKFEKAQQMNKNETI